MTPEMTTEPSPEPAAEVVASPAAQQLIGDLEKVGVQVSDEDRREITAFVSNEELAKEFLEMRLDRAVNPKELVKMGIMSSALFERVKLNPVLMTMHMYTLGTCRRVIDHGENRLAGLEQDGTKLEKPLTEEAELGTRRLILLAAVEMSRMLPRAQKLAQLIQPQDEPKKPKNRPPDSLARPPVMVQNTGNGTVVVQK